MSAIDAYKYELIGIVHCPSPFPLVRMNDSHRSIPIYRLLEDIPAEEDQFDGKAGDLVLGGGLGESAALRVSLPEAVWFWTGASVETELYTPSEKLFRAFWTPSDAFIFGSGYVQLGWKPGEDMVRWVSEHLVAFLLRELPEYCGHLIGPDKLEQDGTIARRATAADLEAWTKVRPSF